MGKATIALLLSAFLLASCSSNGGSSEAVKNTGNSPTAAPSQEASVVPAGTNNSATNSGKPEENLDSPSPQANQDAEGSTSGNEQTAEIPLLYHMNKNYDIVPNKEGTPKKVVLLTFDDGPKEAKMINSIIDTLDKHHAKAIFFVNGYRVKEHPELLKLIYERGGILGNHSWDHIELKDKPYDTVKKQLEDVQTAVKEITGETPHFFRPPYGAGGDVGKKVAAENGMLYMTWSVGSLDWEMKEKNSNKTEKLIGNVTSQLHSGSNILMHELPWTTEALDTLLTTLEEKGYSFVDPRSIELKMR
ncbi:polysaccharide deacetylase family protein [Paenibacillus sp. NPDC057934]|uniref:polysaccharide deacetylase family protein n=1 Tax=Paenibacillus sp. NPDC057934 TaxID=3346282 RepID=UPI0036DEF2CB